MTKQFTTATMKNTCCVIISEHFEISFDNTKLPCNYGVSFTVELVKASELIGLLEEIGRLAQVYILSVCEERLSNFDNAFQNSIFRVLTSFGEMPYLWRLGEFLCRFDELDLERFWELAVGWRNTTSPEYRARS